MAALFTPRNQKTIFGIVRDYIWNYPYYLYNIYSRLRKLKIVSMVLLISLISALLYHFLYIALASNIGLNGDTLYVGVVDPKPIYSPLGTNNLSKTINSLIFNDLFYLDGSGVPTPELAKSWDITGNENSITFHLINATWQDGQKIDADDVIYSFELQKKLNPTGPLSKITMEKSDDQTVTVSVNGLDLSIWQDLHWPIFPSHSVYSTNEQVGSGAYIFESINSGIYNFESNKKYAFGSPKVPNLKLTVYPDEQTLVQAYNDGEVSIAEVFDPSEDASNLILNDTHSHITAKPLNNTYSALFFNVNSITSSAIRQGISYAINKDSLNTILNSYLTLTDGPINPNSWAYSNSKTIQRYGYSTSSALTSFASLGITQKGGRLVDSNGNQLSITIDYDSVSTNLSVLNEIQRQLESIGINVTLKADEPSVWSTQILRDKNYQVAYVQVEGGIDPDPSGLWSSSSDNNISNYKNKAVDEYLDLAKNTPDRTNRIHAYDAFQQALMNDAPAAFLYSPNVILISKSNISTVVPSSLGFEEDVFDDVQYWHM